MKQQLIVVSLCVGFIASSGALAKEACSTELCLGGMLLTGEQADNCKGPIKDFFEIVKFKNGHPSPSRTLNARKSFLNSCPSGDDNKKTEILAKFGKVFL